MSRKKKPRLKVAKEARRRARLGIGLPPTGRTIPNKREKPAKHKKTMGELLGEVRLVSVGSAGPPQSTGFSLHLETICELA
jgi:hypothetical protein